MSSKAAIIGRFQVPEPHNGHEKLFYEVQCRHRLADITVLLGCSRVRFDPKNPFTFQQRADMLKPYLPGVTFVPIMDHPSDVEWSKKVDEILEPGTIIYGGRDSFAPRYHGERTVIILPLDGITSGTSIRRSNGTTELKSHAERLGWMKAQLTVPEMVFPTVDIAAVQDNNLILIKKKGEEGVRFPGGFVDPSDVSFQAAARRELREEISCYVACLEHVGSTIIEDPRYKNTGHRIITTLFAASLSPYADPVAGDDADEVVLVPLKKIDLSMFVPEHRVLWGMFKSYLAQGGIQ